MMSIDTSKYTNHTKEEIEEYLKIVKKSVNAGKFIVCTTEKNEKNRKFIFEYGLTKNKQKYELDNWGTIENVEVYIKIARKQDDFIVVVSFHKPEKNIKKLFL